MSVTRALSLYFPRFNAMLGYVFPLVAVAGLLLAGWGLIVTPDEIRAGGNTSLWKIMNSGEQGWNHASPPSGAAHLK
jgi:hypothetical protein